MPRCRPPLRPAPVLAGLAAALLAAVLGGPALASPAPDFDFTWLGKVEVDAEGLGSSDHKERREAVAALATHHISLTRPHLLRALSDPDRRVRYEAGRMLAKHGITEITPTIIGWLDEPDGEVKKDAVEILGILATDAAVSALVRTLGDVDDQVRRKAVEALGRVGTPAVVVPLIGRLDDNKFEVRKAAIEELERLADARAVIPLVGAFDDTSSAVREAAIRAVGRLGDAAATPALLRLMRDPDEDIRRAAVTSLGNLAAADAADLLIDELAQRHSDAYLAEIAYALGKIARRAADPAQGPPSTAQRALARRAVRALVEALPRGGVRAAAREGLRHAGAVAVPALVAHLEGRSDGDPATAVEILRDIGDPRATPALVDELERGRMSRELVLEALEAAGDRRALLPILGLLSSPEAPLRLRAMEALRPIADDVRAADILAELLDDPDVEIRILAAEYLGLMRARRAVPALLARIGPGHPPRLRLAAVDALGEIADPRAVPGLVDLLASGPGFPGAAGSPDAAASLQAAAASALIYIGDRAAVAPLVALARDPRARSRAQALRSLGGVLRGRPAGEARELAEELAQSEDLAMSLAAIEALGAMGDPAAAPALRALAGADIHRRRAALAALGNLGDQDALPALLEALDAGDDRLSGDAAWALGKLAHAGALDPLVRATRRRGWASAINATAALARYAPAERAGDLVPLLYHRDRLVRTNAATGLGRMQARDALEPLGAVLVEDPSPLVRAAAARALSRVATERDRSAREALGRARDQDDDERVRAAAGAALERVIEPPPRADWRSFLIVDPDRDGVPVSQADYFLVAADGLVTAHYSDARGYITEEQFPPGDHVLASRSHVARY